MSNAKEAILKSIRDALGEVPGNEQPKDVAVPRAYHQKGELSEDEMVALFAERIGEYKATVRRVGKDMLQNAVAQACKVRNVKRLVVPSGFPPNWLPESINPLYDTSGEPLSHEDLDASDGVVTLCALAVAQTGTIILNAGAGQGRRALTLLPDYHLCIVGEDQIVELIPEAFKHFSDQINKEGPPITLISGPSATSDIELSRVEGVHGPRRLEVLIVGD